MLTDNGLTYLEDGVAQDLIVVDQIKGPMAYCEWVEFRFGNLDDDPKKRVAGCRLKDGEQTELATPEGWEYEESLSASYMFTPTEHVEKGLTFLRREDGLDVYRSETTGKEVYMGRSYGDDDEP